MILEYLRELYGAQYNVRTGLFKMMSDSSKKMIEKIETILNNNEAKRVEISNSECIIVIKSLYVANKLYDTNSYKDA